MARALNYTLPSGASIWAPATPRTWTEQAGGGGTRGDPIRAKHLEGDVSATVALHRQRPLFQGYRSASLSVATGTWTPIPLDVELVDTVSGHSDSTNTDRWYAPDTSTGAGTPDYYLCTGYVSWATTDAANVFAAGVKKNTEANPREGAILPRPAGHDMTGMVRDLIALDGAFSDYVSLQGWHNHGSSASTVASSHAPSMTVRWVSAGTGTTVTLPATPHTWTAADEAWADSAGGAKVPLNLELRDRIRFYNYPPIARLTSETSAQTIPSGAGTWTSVNMPTVTVDNYAGWSSGANARYTCQRPGLYFVYGQAALLATNAGAGTYVAARISHNIALGGTADYYGDATLPPTTIATGTTVAAHGLIRMAANDFVVLQASHNLGAAKTVKATAGGACRLIAVWMAA
jgi:hypothetical protein